LNALVRWLLQPRGLLLGVAALALASLGIALIAQHWADMRPCPWCVLQRLIYLGIVLVAVLGWAIPVIALALSGVAAALWQSFGAADAGGCNLTLADRIVGATGLDQALPAIFGATANCDEANVPLFGVPFATWSLTIFALMAALALASLWLGRRRPLAE
jgi:protein dithiol:quinone oxidoreductase